ncbi:MAG: cyanoexosortase A system-associated protein [Hydrococcus sp. RU_2_2]|nr:cyanoexosortase A system-associated protein [Hydrococcus sp. RU_2_2]NJP20566.1 cyanoexosortase A system-associated protein [Hydrococcus sp. CRU_1_1]
MAKLKWQSVRILLIAVTLSGVIGIFLRAILLSKTDTLLQLHSVNFPATIPLSQWQPLASKTLEATNQAQSIGKQYYYRQNGERLEIKARYEHYTDGNISRLLVVYTPIKPATVQPIIKYQEGIGSYSLFEHEGKAYLSACINYAGESTVTEQQFVQNKYAYGWSPQRTLFWILGQNDLFDGRCLWTLISVPLSSDSYVLAIEKAYGDLENAWFDWYGWWKPRLLQ